MTDDGFDSKAKPDRPVWSHKAEGGYLESFLQGGTAEEEQPAAAPAESAAVESAGEPPLEERVIAALRQIYDPEIPVNIYDLGLIYGVEADGDNNVDVTMTLTTPHCPVAESLPMEVEAKVRSVEGVNDVDLDLVWDPPWDMSKMSDEARLELGLL